MTLQRRLENAAPACSLIAPPPSPVPHVASSRNPRSALSEYPLSYGKGGGRAAARRHLVALGSVAVLTVYAAGYVRTVPAAHRAALAVARARRVPLRYLHFKDGTYFGWGGCPHGQLQAAVVIKDGRIADASISLCFTRYSADVIARLPPDVVAHQTPDVDIVSGATESSDAFYLAVMRALGQAL